MQIKKPKEWGHMQTHENPKLAEPFLGKDQDLSVLSCEILASVLRSEEHALCRYATCVFIYPRICSLRIRKENFNPIFTF